MSKVLLPTSKAQVSGHRFLQRRVEHALVMGDLRMIHDPLARRSRALLFGVTAAVLLGLGAGLLALLRPAADPGEAPILRADSGALFVRMEEKVHPVANLASARLAIGEPADPARISDEVLLDTSLGPPLGIRDAPGLFIGEPEATLTWSACHDSATDPGVVAVLSGAQSPPRPLGPRQALLAHGGEQEWLITGEGRAMLPAAETPAGRVLRRRLGITSDTPRWQPPAAVLNVIAETPPQDPPVQPSWRILDTEAESWLDRGRGVVALSQLQREILADLGVPVDPVERTRIAEYPDDPDTTALPLPGERPEWLDPVEAVVCASGAEGVPGTLPSLPGGVALSGESVADFYAGPALGAIAVDTGSGYHVVAETGAVHPVADTETLAVLGLATEPGDTSWEILRLLPRGSELSRAEALQTAVTGSGEPPE